MKIYLNQNVFDAAVERMNWLFDEFKNIYACISGGKDSTVVLNLALMVAEERGRLPLPVIFIDQEAEWQTVIDHIRTVMDDERVDPHWLQMPMKIFNATSTEQPWLKCWEPGAEWIRQKEPDSEKENIFGEDRFKYIFEGISRAYHPNEPVAQISGVRCEESPGRYAALTMQETYKGHTWGKLHDKKKGHYAFYPVYDWTYKDVWKSIHDNGWSYCAIYDYMYQYGLPVQQMRVSNVHHEQAVETLFYLQEVESETWNRITQRVQGANTLGQMQESFFAPRKLPYMFDSWIEYRDYLLEKLIPDPDIKKRYKDAFQRYDDRFLDGDEKEAKRLIRTEIKTILLNDYHFTKLGIIHARPCNWKKNRKRR